MATPTPARRSISASLPASPKAMTSEASIPKASMRSRMPVAFETPGCTTSK